MRENYVRGNRAILHGKPVRKLAVCGDGCACGDGSGCRKLTIRGRPIKQAARVPEAHGTAARPQDDNRDLIALRDLQECGEAIACLVDEARLAAADIDAGAKQLVGAVDWDYAS